jgi:hypothetical protein
LFREAFPETPFFFVYRNPSEILASHRRQCGSQMVPGMFSPQMLGLDSQPVDPADLDGYCLRVLSSIFRSAAVHAQTDDVLLINYSQLPALIWHQFADVVSLELATTEIESMQTRSMQHSKQPVG